MGGSGHGRAGGRSGQSLATWSALWFCAAIMRPATGFPWTLMQKRLNKSRLASCSAVLHGRRQRVTSSAVAAAYA